MENNIRPRVVKHALQRIKNFLSENCIHWKQDIGYIETKLAQQKEEIELLQKYNFDYVKELNLLREFAEFIIKNSHIWTDKVGYELEFRWISLNAYIPEDEVDVIKEVFKTYGLPNK